MRAVFEIRNGVAAIQMDASSLWPSFGEAAALAKMYGHRMAECSYLSDAEIFTLFKTIYASMVLEYATEKGITMSPEMEEETQKKAMDYAGNVTIKMMEHDPSTLFQEEGKENSLCSDPEDLPF